MGLAAPGCCSAVCARRVGLTGLVPFSMTFGTVNMLGTTVTWWIPLLIVGVLATAFAYAASITAAEMLGSRLSSFAGLLEVVAGGGVRVDPAR